MQTLGRLALACVAAAMCWPAFAQSTGFGELRPFVVGVVPVVGAGGAVGGVSIDAKGVLSRAVAESNQNPRVARAAAAVVNTTEIDAKSPLRKVSLRRLIAEIDKHRTTKQPLGDALQNLAGLTRIEYVFAYPEQQDIVIAGPAEGWRTDELGYRVTRSTSEAVLQLDDLVVALRMAKAAGTDRGISCSIDPSEDGLRRLRPLLKSPTFNETIVARMERALGPQQITVTGVPPSSHIAHVLVSADFVMKRLGMGFEASPLANLPSYIDMLTAHGAPQARTAMPRWWMAPHYEPLLRDAEGLAWRLRGAGVQILTEDGYLGAAGTVVNSGREDPLAKKWADAMTNQFPALCKALPPLAQLRGCMDLAVLAALLVKENLPGRTGCDPALLLDVGRLTVAEYPMAKTVDSRAKLARKGRDWIISLSGGVQVDSWSVVGRVETNAALRKPLEEARPILADHWWWD